MRKIDWNNVNEATDYPRPEPGGYIAQITLVEDHEDKEYLQVEWDFADGALKGQNRETFRRAGFWPYPLFRSYKESALPFFKAFKTALEKSNSGYVFDEAALDAMRGKFIGVILGEEEYIARDGQLKTSLKVQDVRSVQAIREGDFKVPEIKRVRKDTTGYSSYEKPQFEDLEDSGDLPF